MGYTTQKESLLLALGVSSISDLDDLYVQNYRKLSEYYKALDENRWPIAKGHVLTAEDKLRRSIIMELLCHLEVPLSWVESFEDERLELEPMVQDGFLKMTSEKIQVTELGRVFLRNIGMVFDAYLSKEALSSVKLYSRTI